MKIHPEDVEANIESEWYINAGAAACQLANDFQPPAPSNSPLYLLTICVLVLKNGFTVTGESACADPAIFDADLGKKFAREAAVRKIWPLMGYELRTQIAESQRV